MGLSTTLGRGWLLLDVIKGRLRVKSGAMSDSLEIDRKIPHVSIAEWDT